MMALPAMSLAVVGADHPNKRGPSRRFELNICRPGEPVALIPEPKNPKDENAVGVFSERGVQLGYLKAERAPWIGGMLKQGREITAKFQGKAAFGGWIRIAFDGAQPDLPPDPPAERTEIDEFADEPAPDFYPDQEWPD